MVDGIRIDELTPATLVEGGYLIPVMLGGVTYNLSVGQIQTLITAALVDSAPATLDTLNELAAALGDDPNFATTITSLVAQKLALAGGTMSGALNLAGQQLQNPLIVDPRGLLLTGYISGLVMSNDITDGVNDLRIAAGQAASDEATPRLMVLAEALIKRTDAAWEVGTGNGGWLDGSSMPNGPGHVFLIQRSDTGVVDVGLSASLTPTLPTGYDRKRRVGSIVKSGGSVIGFKQYGNRIKFNNDILTFSDTSLRASAPLTLSGIPTGIPVLASLRAKPISANGSVLSMISTDWQANSNTSATYTIAEVSSETDTSAQIALSAVGTAHASIAWELYVKGWTDYTR